MKKKIMITILVIGILLNILIIPVNAKMDINDITKPPAVDPTVTESINFIWNNISTVISIVGVGIASIMLIVVAIKYMLAAPGEKAQLKQHLLVYVIGAFFIFCCVGIVNLIKTLVEQIF